MAGTHSAGGSVDTSEAEAEDTAGEETLAPEGRDNNPGAIELHDELVVQAFKRCTTRTSGQCDFGARPSTEHACTLVSTVVAVFNGKHAVFHDNFMKSKPECGGAKRRNAGAINRLLIAPDSSVGEDGLLANKRRRRTLYDAWRSHPPAAPLQDEEFATILWRRRNVELLVKRMEAADASGVSIWSDDQEAAERDDEAAKQRRLALRRDRLMGLLSSTAEEDVSMVIYMMALLATGDMDYEPPGKPPSKDEPPRRLQHFLAPAVMQHLPNLHRRAGGDDRAGESESLWPLIIAEGRAVGGRRAEKQPPQGGGGAKPAKRARTDTPVGGKDKDKKRRVRDDGDQDDLLRLKRAIRKAKKGGRVDGLDDLYTSASACVREEFTIATARMDELYKSGHEILELKMKGAGRPRAGTPVAGGSEENVRKGEERLAGNAAEGEERPAGNAAEGEEEGEERPAGNAAEGEEEGEEEREGRGGDDLMKSIMDCEYYY